MTLNDQYTRACQPQMVSVDSVFRHQKCNSGLSPLYPAPVSLVPFLFPLLATFRIWDDIP